MKKFCLIFVISILFVFVSCESNKKTNEKLPESEFTDEDVIYAEQESTDSDEETLDSNSDSDSDTDDTDDTDSDSDNDADTNIDTDINTDSDTDSGTDSDADITNNDYDTDTDSDTTNNDDDTDSNNPCEPNPCDNVTDSKGICTIIENNYSCECNQGYYWTGSICKSNETMDSMSLGNICTGLDKCYDNFGSAIDCPLKGQDFYGQDAQYAEQGICTPQSFIINDISGAEIVIDNNTGLIWLHSPLTGKYTWEEANNECLALNNSQYAGYSDWRLPIPTELLTIVENDYLNSAFNMQHIENSSNPSDTEILWTSKEYDRYNAYSFSPFDGSVSNDSQKTNAYEVLCVSGRGFNKGSFTERTEHGKTVVVDSTTGLMWQKEYATDKPWRLAIAYCQTLNEENYANHNDWRLPNKNELSSLLNYDEATPFYSDFPEMPLTNKWFWSSTTVLTIYADQAWNVDFTNGLVSGKEKTNIAFVKCVR